MPVEVQKEDFTKKYSVKKPVTFDSPPEEKKKFPRKGKPPSCLGLPGAEFPNDGNCEDFPTPE